MIRAIETRYAGCRFRSRLEARWAVFFDQMKIPWEYEPEGYRLPSGAMYLPDFLIDGKYYAEVKGSDSAIDKPVLLEFVEHVADLLILGPIPYVDIEDEPAWLSVSGVLEPEYAGYVSFCGWKRNNRLWVTGYGYEKGDDWTKPKWDSNMYYSHGDNTFHAYEAARSARFEHGESGA